MSEILPLRDVEAHVVRWDAEKGVLVDSNGDRVTHAQDVKAARYVKGGKIRKLPTVGDPPGWGQAWTETETYELDPIPGCREVRKVVVASLYAGDGALQHRQYRCDCQAFVLRRRACSHVLAVHAWRAVKRPEASP